MNVSAGDLAYITGVTVHPENNGAIVSVVEWIDYAGKWLCQSKTPLTGSEGGKNPKRTLEGIIDDKYLRRIAGSGVDISETTEKPIKQPTKEPA